MATAGYFPLGYISKTKGLKGELLLKSELAQLEAYQETESVFLEIKGKPVPFFVLSFRPQPGKKTASLLLEEVDTVEKARELTGTTVLLPVSAQVPAEAPPFSDLKDYQVIDRIHGSLGPIHEIIQYPGHTVAVLPYQGRDILVPMNEALIERIDKQKRQLFVTLPEGLLEIYLY